MPSTPDPVVTLADFPVHRPVTTRWSDNDMYGHLNNAVYYEPVRLGDQRVAGRARDGRPDDRRDAGRRRGVVVRLLRRGGLPGAARRGRPRRPSRAQQRHLPGSGSSSTRSAARPPTRRSRPWGTGCTSRSTPRPDVPPPSRTTSGPSWRRRRCRPRAAPHERRSARGVVGVLDGAHRHRPRGAHRRRLADLHRPRAVTGREHVCRRAGSARTAPRSSAGPPTSRAGRLRPGAQSRGGARARVHRRHRVRGSDRPDARRAGRPRRSRVGAGGRGAGVQPDLRARLGGGGACCGRASPGCSARPPRPTSTSAAPLVPDPGPADPREAGRRVRLPSWRDEAGDPQWRVPGSPRRGGPAPGSAVPTCSPRRRPATDRTTSGWSARGHGSTSR